MWLPSSCVAGTLLSADHSGAQRSQGKDTPPVLVAQSDTGAGAKKTRQQNKLLIGLEWETFKEELRSWMLSSEKKALS